MTEILQNIHGTDFLGFSYGFRKGKSQHDALDALSVGIFSKKVSWILDADIEGFFDTINHDRMITFLERRIGDRRVLRLIRNWLQAGVSEDGEVTKTSVGTPQGAVMRSDGSFTIHRHIIAKRMRATLQAIRLELRKRMHHPLGEVGRWLRRVVQGWMNYHAVPSNSDRVRRFVDEVTRNWLRAIRRRSQRGKNPWTWERMRRLGRKHLPQPHIIHPYPEQRFRARLKAGAV